jgi:hypothetical protein
MVLAFIVGPSVGLALIRPINVWIVLKGGISMGGNVLEISRLYLTLVWLFRIHLICQCHSYLMMTSASISTNSKPT